MADSQAERPSIVAGLAGIAVLFGSVAAAFGLLPRLMHVEPIPTLATIVLSVLALASLIAGIVWLPTTIKSLLDAESLAEPERSDILYGRYLVGVGFALLTDALICSVVVVAMAWTTGRARLGHLTTGGDREVQQNLNGDAFDAAPLDHLQELGATGAAIDRFGTFFGHSADDALFIAALFTLSTLVALLGALFFFATSLWRKMGEEEQEPFDRSIFWAGLWFRVGEAVLFNLVFFLLLRYYAPEQYLALPIVSLLVGMFLKAGEKLIAGMATRVFAAFDALVPTSLKPASAMKLMTLKPSALPEDDAARAKALKSIAKSIESVTGVGRVIPDVTSGTIRVEYDAAQLSPSRVQHELHLIAGQADAS